MKKISKFNVYCGLVIGSKTLPELPQNLFLAKIKNRVELTDNFSPERIAQRAIFRTCGIPIPEDSEHLARYWWSLSTQNRIDSYELHDHLHWLLAHFRSGVKAGDFLHGNYRGYLSVFWGASKGTGGGPLISPATSELLAMHQLPLDIGFYVA